MKINRHGQAKILSGGEIQALFNGLFTARDRALFGICLYGAARINEAVTLYRADVFSGENIRERLILRKSNTKGKKNSREILINPILKQYLLDWDKEADCSKTDHLFPGRWGLGHLSTQGADLTLREACRRIGIEGVSTHSFRRTALTQMHNAGIPLRHIQEISGHSTLTALQAYLGVGEEDKDRAVLSLNF